MIETALGRGMAFTAPHRLATKAGADILEAGGTAVEAMVAAAATIAVVYPHMTAIGGDGFWVIKRPGAAPQGIFACGPAAAAATVDWYAERGHTEELPTRGAEAALTVPGTISGWAKALEMDGSDPSRLSDLLSIAISHAREGIAVSRNQSETTEEKLEGLRDVPGFAEIFLQDGEVPAPGASMTLPALADTLARLAEAGLDDYYRGDIGATHGRFLAEAGSPLTTADLNGMSACKVTPLTLTTRQGTLYNMIPPTQGMSSLAILGIFDRLGIETADGFDHWHGLIEATKQAFIVRNRELGDERAMRQAAQSLLSDAEMDRMAAAVDLNHALPWPHEPKDGDTIWMGAVDRDGTAVSFIQSVYWEFGSGLACPETGVYFQNRGAGFSLAPGPNQLRPGHHPFHTLNPALAELSDGRIMAYGTMGGEGQPQTQAALFTRYAMFGRPLQEAITAPRWLLGRTWGDVSTSLKIEETADPGLVDALRGAGHVVEIVPGYSSLMGHAGAVVLHPDGMTEAATDPRSDGWAYAR